MKKIKILHISETFVTGVYTYIQSICAFTDQYPEMETYIIYSPNREGTDVEKFRSDFSKRIKLIPLDMHRELSFKGDNSSLKLLKQQIKKIKPDVIHLHSSKAGVLGRIASKVYPKASVYYTPNGYAFLRQDVSKKKRRFYKTIEKYIATLYGGTTIACGDTEYEYAKKLGKAILIRNGIDLLPLEKISVSTSKNLKTIVTLGRISPQKNPELFNKVALEFPNLNFTWIGDGELKHQLTSSNITITGWLDRKKALELLAKQDIYMQTSLWEGLPFTIIEAMALQKPIIATDVVGNKDAVSHEENGFLCKSINDFKTAINQLTLNPELLKRFGKVSKTLAEEKFDRDENFKDLVKIYFDQDI